MIKQYSVFAFIAATAMVAGASPVTSGAIMKDYGSRAPRMYKATTSDVFKSEAFAKKEAMNRILRGENAMQKVSDKEPVATHGPSSVIGDITAPNGETWNYTGNLDYERIPHDAYTEYKLKHFSYTIYNARGEKVGTVSDDIHYAEDEVRAVGCDFTPIITRNFFNTDDKYEVCIGLSFNTKEVGMNRYKSLIYSIGGEKDGENDKIIRTMDSFVGDVVEGPASADGRDNFFLTFSKDENGTPEDPESFWSMLQSYSVNVVTYGRALNDTDGPRPLLTKNIPLLNLPGNQDTTPFLFSMVHEGQVYIILQMLKEPLWMPYDSPMDEYEQRADNTLVVNFYKADENAITLDYTTPIAVNKSDDSAVYVTYYSVGDMRYRGDVLFGKYGESAHKAALFVTAEDYYTLADKGLKSYYVYDSTGKRLKTLAESTEFTQPLSDIKDAEPQQLFVTAPNDQYNLSFVNLLSATEAFNMSNVVEVEDNNFLNVLVNLDRTPVGDSYQYAIECSSPLELDNDRTLSQIVWLDKDGKFDHMEYADLGTDVQYAQLYIESNALEVGKVMTDQRAYIALIKRGIAGSKLDEELLVTNAITNPDWQVGEQALLLGPGEYGVLSGIVPDLYSEVHTLSVYYLSGKNTGEKKLTQVVYALPFLSSGIDMPATDSKTDGTSAKVYNMDGTLAGIGMDTNSLPAGVYIIVNGREARKVIIK
ncbi:MAG: T9SS type A sorting domain-containing protein [Bacteroidales bacterium]|nr:T9SS type A sorting domain-containing protein [Bacteroidales bacterium]